MMKQSKSLTHLMILIVGDLLVLLSFVWIGRRSHNLSMADIGAVLSTTLPFVAGWFLVTPWFGLYRREINQTWRKLAPQLLIAWAIAGPLSLILRALVLGQTIPFGIPPTFVALTLAYIGLVALTWRLCYIWWANRNSKQRTEVKL